ncbi:ribose-5-phosphate isomerase RpiA [Sphingomonas guangdongensis]|nr:ribose-5-phosphate isomerase RpiA [Sphingomonas guangdongensis]
MAADDDKRLAAEAAMAEVVDGMLVGLGTGSTAAHAIRALARRAGDGLRIDCVATSETSAALARGLGLSVRDFAAVASVDLTIDGADEIDGGCRAIKGAGGAMLREKCVAAASRRMVVIADGSKWVDRLGGAPVPVEVLPFAHSFVARVLEQRAMPVLRMVDKAPYLTDQRNVVLDCRFAGLDPAADATWLQSIPGVLGHGLFLSEVAAAYVAEHGNVTRLERSRGTG